MKTSKIINVKLDKSKQFLDEISKYSVQACADLY